MQRKLWIVGLIWIAVILGGCSKKPSGSSEPPPDPPDPPPVTNEVDFYMTNGEQTALIAKQNVVLGFGTVANSNPEILVDTTQRFQTIDGFGYTLTSGSATLINGLEAAVKEATLQNLFGSTGNAINVSYLRLTIGASDLSANVYSYNDMPAGQTDPTLANFSLNVEKAGGTGLIPLLKEILAINPNIKILGSPWSAPLWMKDNGNSVGGSLKPEYYDAYAQYFVKYVQGMKAEGITIDAITPQNEPMHGGNNPSMVMTAEQQRDFIKNSLGPAFQAAAITTKIIIWDHNCDNPGYPITILNDAAAKQFIDGSAFHLYNGQIEALDAVHTAHPDKNLYFTEQYTPANGSFSGDLKWHMRYVIIGSMRNWSKNALEWNLANDATFGPHTVGGCDICKGALTIVGASSVTRNVGYYIIGQASRFVLQGSTRVTSTNNGDIHSAAFERPDKKKVLVVLNDGSSAATFNIKFKNKWVSPTLPAGAVGTFVW